MSALPTTSRTASRGQAGASVTRPAEPPLIADGVERATHATASASMRGMGPSNRRASNARVPGSLSDSAASTACSPVPGRCCCGYRPSASRPATDGTRSAPTRTPHPPQQLLAVLDLCELLGSSSTGPNELLDQLCVEVVARCTRCRLGIESWLPSTGQQSLHLGVRRAVVTIPGSDPHASMCSARHPARLL